MATCLLHGNEPYLLNQYINEIIEKTNFPEMNVSKFEVFDADALLACDQLPVMNDYRVVIIEGDLFKTKNELLLDYIKKDSPKTMLLLVPTNIHRGKSLYKVCKDAKGIKEFMKLGQPKNSFSPVDIKPLYSFINDRISNAGGSISFKDTEHLISRIGYFENDLVCLYDVISSIDKLVLYNKNITRKSIDTLIKKSTNENVFLLIDFLIKKDSKGAFEHLKGLLETNSSPIALMSLILRHYRLLYKVSCYDTKDKKKIASDLGISPYALNKVIQQNIDINIINKSIDACNENISGVKQGRFKENISIELLLAKILSF